jgi:pimeloyl-ACP methyl ester carboxylesterase
LWSSRANKLTKEGLPMEQPGRQFSLAAAAGTAVRRMRRSWAYPGVIIASLVAGPMLPAAIPASAAESAAGRYAELPGVKLWFTDTGGTGTPIVFLHANTGTAASWEIQNVAFSRAGFRVIAFDRRGWGNSKADPATGAQPGSVAGDLEALADYLKLAKFHLVGVAGGGFAALDYAGWHPERLRSLVVAASTGQFSEPEIDAIRARVQFPELGKIPVVYREVGPSYRGGNPDGTRRWMTIEEHTQQAGAPAQPLHTPNTYAKLAAVTMPTLVLAADADLLAPPSMMRAWAAHLSNYQFAMVPESGHSIAWEQPEIFDDTVLAFISRH